MGGVHPATRVAGHGSQRSLARAASTTPKTTQELLAKFDKNVAAARSLLTKASDPDLHKNWSLLSNGTALLTMPRIACLRTWVMNHGIHHRAQLGVYLRLNNIPVPATYGPSADENGM